MSRRFSNLAFLALFSLLVGCSGSTAIAPTAALIPSNATPAGSATPGRVGPGTTASTPDTPVAVSTPRIVATPVIAAQCAPINTRPATLPGSPTAATSRASTSRTPTPVPTAILVKPGSPGTAYRYWQHYENEDFRSPGFDLSPDGSTVATGADTNQIMLLDVATGQVRTISTGATVGTKFQFSPDSQTIAFFEITHAESVISLWDVGTGAARRTIAVPVTLATTPRFQPGGTLLAVATTDGLIRLWDLATGQERPQLQDNSQVSDLAFSVDGRTLGTFHSGTDLYLWDIATGQKRTIPAPGAGSFAFSPDGTTIAVGQADGTLALLDVVSGARRWSKSAGKSQPSSLAFTTDSKTLFSSEAKVGISVWDAANGTQRQTIASSASFSTDFRADASGRLLVQRGNKALHFYTFSDRAERYTLDQRSPTEDLAFSPNGCLLAVPDAELIRLYDAATGTIVRTIDGREGLLRSLAFSPDGTLLATGDARGRARVWEVASGSELRNFSGPSEYVLDLAFSPDGRTLAAGGLDKGLGRVISWDLASGQVIFNQDWTRIVHTIAFTPDGNSLLVGGNSDEISVVNSQTGRTQRSLKLESRTTVYDLAVSLDGTHLASAADNSITIWNLPDGRVLNRIATFSSSLAFTPDARTLIINSSKGPVIIWDLNLGREKDQLPGHTGLVTAIALSSDGRTVASGGADKTVWVWDIAPLLASSSLDGTAKITTLAPSTP